MSFTFTVPLFRKNLPPSGAVFGFEPSLGKRARILWSIPSINFSTGKSLSGKTKRGPPEMKKSG
jgi:hypothetical protein